MTRLHKKSSGSFVIIVGIALLVAVLLFMKLRTSTPRVENNISQFYNRQLQSIEIFESLDANTRSPRFKLHAQSKEPMTSVPEKVLLIEKNTKNIRQELSLTKSENEEECLPHSHMPIHSMPKWDTEWFSLEEIPSVNNEYSSKLVDTYSIVVLYKDGSMDQLSSSVHEITDVCYHVSKATPMTPFPRSEN